MRNQLTRFIGLGIIAAASAHAATNIIDFNTDPETSGLYVNVGAGGEWRPNGGASGADGDGYLKITDARGNEVAKLVFKDLEPGLVVKAFEFECDLRIGGGTARPADGFSLNFVSTEDPMITNADDGIGTAGGDYAGTDNETSLPEEGSLTGLGIGFDTWESATISGVQDVVGISIRVNGALVAQLPVPLQPGNVFTPGEPNPTGAETYGGPEYTYNGVPFRNLSTNDANYAQSMQTGALNTTDDLNEDGVVDGNDAGAAQVDISEPTWDLWVQNLKWEKFKAVVDESGRVSIFWKGVELTPPGGLATGFNPIPGRLVFGGRTGGAWEVHHVDNIRLVTIPADFVLIGNAVGNPIGFSISVTDSGPAITDTNTIELKFNDVVVTPSEVAKNAGTTTIKYANLASPLAPGASDQKVSLTISDTRGVAQSADRFFTVPAYQTVPAEYAVTGVDPAQGGFNVTWHQSDTRGLETTVARAEQQLYGLRGANLFTSPTEEVADVINYDQVGNAAGTWNLNTSEGGEYTDKVIPLPDPGYTDNIAAAIETYLHFPEPGVYNVIFNSDDGFRTTISPNSHEVLKPIVAAQFDGGRGASDTVATLFIPTAGYYPFRTVWFEGGGGANLEWVAERVAPNTMPRALINDTLRPSVKAYRVRTGATPAAVSFLHPFAGSGNPYLPTVPLIVELEQGTDAIDQNSIALKLNGEVVTPTKATAGNKTTLNYDPPGNLPAGTNTVEVTFAAGTQQYAGTNTFVVRDVPSVPPSLALPASAVNTANVGFLVKTLQQDSGESMANDTYRGLVHAANLIGLPNTADLSAFTGPEGYYVETGLINYTSTGEDGFFDFATGWEDAAVPGIPGTATAGGGTDNFVQEILTVLNLSAGVHVMNVNSDDGFLLTIGNPKEGFSLPVMVGEFSGGRGAGGGLGSGTTFYFNVPTAGLYPARLIWYEAGGGAGIEWSEAALDGNGFITEYRLINDVSTPGGVAAYQYPLTSPGSPYLASFSPARSGRGNRAGVNAPIKATLVDGVNAIDPNSVSLALDGLPVTLPAGAVTKSGTTTTLNYKPADFAAGSSHTVALTVGDRTFNWSFTVNSSSLNTSTFFIEAEDFNFGGGQTRPEASVMPYAGGAYAGLSATPLIDYNRPSEGASPIYRIGEDPQVPMDRTGDRDRGDAEIVVNYKLGWTADGQWLNYTRTFPADTYNIYAGLSHGDPATSATRVAASLDRVTSDPTQPNQTTISLGTFDGPSTGGWGNNALVPLMSGGSLAAVGLSGAETLRVNLGSGDFDFLEFIPIGVPQVRITNVSLADGQVTVVWTGGGTLYSSPSLSAPNWATTGDSDGSYTAPVGPDPAFFRVQGP